MSPRARLAPGDSLEKARKLAGKGLHEEAARACTELISRGKGGEAALALRAQAWRDCGRHDLCLADLSALVDAAPREPARLVARGEGARHVCDFAGAERDARAALSLRPGDLQALLLLSEALRGAGRWRDAATSADDAIAAAPREAWPLIVRAKARRLTDPAAALADAEAAARLSPKDHYAAGWSGEILRRLGRPREALVALDRGVAAAPTIAWMRALRGEARRETGKAEEGLADVLEAVRLDGNVSCAYDMLGGDSPEVRADKSSSWLFAWRGAWRRGRGLAGGAEDLSLAAALDPSCLWARAWRGEAALAEGRAEDARRDLAAAVAGLPRYADARVWLGRALLDADDAAGALVQFEAAAASDKRHALARVGMAVALEALGRGARAKTAMAAAYRLDPRLKTAVGA